MSTKLVSRRNLTMFTEIIIDLDDTSPDDIELVIVEEWLSDDD